MTKHDENDTQSWRDRPVKIEITEEITEEMIEAGERALLDYDRNTDSSRDAIFKIIMAMTYARKI